MFENSEKLLIFLVIALIFLGPEKMAGLGATLGRAIRDFRSTMRGAQETFQEEFSSAARELSSPAMEEPAALPAPEPAVRASQDAPPAPAAAPESAPRPAEIEASAPGTTELDDQSSLASEPTAKAIADQRSRADPERGR